MFKINAFSLKIIRMRGTPGHKTHDTSYLRPCDFVSLSPSGASTNQLLSTKHRDKHTLSYLSNICANLSKSEKEFYNLGNLIELGNSNNSHLKTARINQSG
jgi:hypothetical protein